MKQGVPTPVSDAMRIQRQREEEERQAEMEALLKSDDPSSLVGQTIAGQGVFIGRFTLQSRWDKNDGTRVFNLFAAPTDLLDDDGRQSELTYDEAQERVANLTGWNGHDGKDYGDGEGIKTALRGDYYEGNWFIPIYEMLHGGRMTIDPYPPPLPGSLYAQRGTGDLKGTFQQAVHGENFYSDVYWSSTQSLSLGPSHASAVSFSDYSNEQCTDKTKKLHVRPVRLVQVGDRS
jgi:hypothetical protein